MKYFEELGNYLSALSDWSAIHINIQLATFDSVLARNVAD
jgi:hypothetical protein